MNINTFSYTENKPVIFSALHSGAFSVVLSAVIGLSDSSRIESMIVKCLCKMA